MQYIQYDGDAWGVEMCVKYSHYLIKVLKTGDGGVVSEKQVTVIYSRLEKL